MALDWTQQEVSLIVSDYFNMLHYELRGEKYSKSTFRNAIRPLLNNRSDRSIESKHQNISAILIELGLPFISGYKPLSNYQKLLKTEVISQLQTTYSNL